MPRNSPEYRRAYYLANREKLIAQTKAWTDAQTPEQKEATRIRKLEWARANPYESKEEGLARAKAYYHANKAKILARLQAKRDADHDFGKKAYARSEELRPGLRAQREKKWRIDNPEKWLERKEKYRVARNQLSKQRRAENPTRKLAENARSRVHHILKREQVTKSQSTFKFIGCTAEFFREFLEAQFTSGMTWENYGITWVVDHVMPLAGFDLTNPDHLRNAFHYSNCRPFGSIPNSIKSDSMPGPHQPLLV